MSTTNLIVAVRTHGGAALAALGANFRRLAQNADRHLRQMATSSRRHATSALGSLQRFGQQAGNAIANGLSGVSGALPGALGRALQALPPQVQAGALAAGAAIGAMLATALLAAVDSLLLVGIGGGTLAAGIAVAAHDPRVAAAFSGLKDTVAAELKAAALPMVGPLINAAGILKKAWSDSIGSGVRDAFRELSGVIEPLAAGLAGLGRNAMPGFLKAVSAAKPLLIELGRMLPLVGSRMSEFFGSIAAGKQGSLKALRALVLGLSGALVTVGNILEWASKKFDKVATGADVVAHAMQRIPLLGRLFDSPAKTLDAINFGLDKTTGTAEQAGTAIGGVGSAADRAAASLKKMSDQWFATIDAALASSDAAIAYERAIDAVSESFKENGKSLDITNEKGRKNVETVNAVIKAAEAQRQANIDNGMSVQQANSQYEAQVGALKNVLRQMGLTQAQIDALIGSYERIPKSVTTTVRTVFVNEGERSPVARPGLFVARAAGGPVRRGMPYTVGEKGPETFVPDANGRILPYVPSSLTGGGSGRGGTTHAELSISGSRSTGLDGVFRKWLDDQLYSGRIKLQVTNGRVRPV